MKTFHPFKKTRIKINISNANTMFVYNVQSKLHFLVKVYRATIFALICKRTFTDP